MLTARQKEVLDFIVSYQRENNGISPALSEIGSALLIENKSSVHRLVSQLEERGFINRLARRARAIEVLYLAEPPRIPIYDARTHRIRGYVS